MSSEKNVENVLPGGKQKKSGIFRKLHRWPGLIISFILMYFAFSGIIMNHRELFSGIDISRGVLPEVYRYRNWNNAALKGSLVIGKDSLLLYGNIGIWLTDSDYNAFHSLNSGFPEGSDSRKIFDVHMADDGELYAATLLGIYAFDREEAAWQKLNEGNERFSSIESNGDTLYVISRSHLYRGISEGVNTNMKRTEISAPEGYENRVTLFQTVWQIHSGEIFGLPGKIFVDILGGVTLFLSVTGIIYFFFPGWIKRRFRREDSTFRLVKISTWSLKWHNKVGAWTFILLIILFFSGMFLRPPLLLAIANAGLKPLKFTHLDQPNPWYDKLRDIKYDVTRKVFFLSTSDGMYLMDPLKLKPVMCAVQPPVSVMGINSFESYHGGSFLVGSFSGLYLWNPDKSIVTDFLTGLPAIDNKGGRPAGDFKITGTVTDSKGNFFIVEYDKGVIPIAENASFPQMPGAITGESPMSLWNFCLEVHTGRIFQGLFGDFYILIVPLTGIAGIVIVISGYMVWRRRYRKK